jgi:hypothetical protein
MRGCRGELCKNRRAEIGKRGGRVKKEGEKGKGRRRMRREGDKGRGGGEREI